MDPVYRDAINVIRGEMNGDTFVWDHEYWDDDGRPVVGAFQSFIEKQSGGITPEV